MKEPNSILEFFGILLLMGVIMAIIITLLAEGKEKLSNIYRDNKKTRGVNEDSHLLKAKLNKYEDLGNYKHQNNLSENSFNEIGEMKLFINRAFYDFCFNTETAKIFLIESEVQSEIILGFIMFQFEKEQLLEKIMKEFFKRKYVLDLGEGSYNFYIVGGYKFYVDVHREYCNDENSYFEILYNDFENVVDKNNNEVAIARKFIVYCDNNCPKAIFVLVYEPFLKKYFIRRVFENGESMVVASIEDEDNDELLRCLENYVIKL